MRQTYFPVPTSNAKEVSYSPEFLIKIEINHLNSKKQKTSGNQHHVQSSPKVLQIIYIIGLPFQSVYLQNYLIKSFLQILYILGQHKILLQRVSKKDDLDRDTVYKLYCQGEFFLSPECPDFLEAVQANVSLIHLTIRKTTYRTIRLAILDYTQSQ